MKNKQMDGLRKEFQDWYEKRSVKGHIPLYAIEYWWLKKINKILTTGT